MIKNRLHLVPQVIIDVANNLSEAERESLKENYRERLEATRDYCDVILRAYRKDKDERKKNRR
jgi:hypothetical protein